MPAISTPNMTRRRFHRTMEMIPALPPLSKKAQSQGTQGVRARYDAELPPFISIVRQPGRPIILSMEDSHCEKKFDIVFEIEGEKTVKSAGEKNF